MGRLWWRRTPHPAAARSPAWRGTAAYSALAVALGAGVLHVIPGPPRGPADTPSTAPAQVRTDAAFRRIVLPDLAVIERAGVSPAEVSRIAKVPGVRQVLPLDGALVTMNGHQVSVIGVNAQQYRSWTPLSTASNQQLWNALGSGGFVASPKARHRLPAPPRSACATRARCRWASAASTWWSAPRPRPGSGWSTTWPC